MVSMDSGMVSTDSGDGEHGSVEGPGSPGSSAEGDSLAAKRLTMRQLREILRLKLGCGLPQRAVATAVKAGTGTVSEYLGLARAAGVGWPIPEELASDEALEARVFGVKAEAQSDRAAVDAAVGACRAAAARGDAEPAVAGVPGGESRGATATASSASTTTAGASGCRR